MVLLIAAHNALLSALRAVISSTVYPGHAPFGYRNNKADRTIEIDPVDSPMVIRMMELYATGAHTLSTLRDVLKTEYGKVMSRGNIHLVLKNRFYTGYFEWAGETYPARTNFHRPEDLPEGTGGAHRSQPAKYSKQEIAFRGLMTCAHDGCMLTGDVQKQKYIYYRCTGNRGKCDLPRFKEEVLSERLGESLKGLRCRRRSSRTS